MLIDATMKEDFPPLSLPKREYMERAKAIWEELGLPPLRPQAPWFGVSLGEWSDDLEQAARLAVAGDYFKTGEAMQRLFADLPEALDNTAEIARRCAYRPLQRQPILPPFLTGEAAPEQRAETEAAELRRQS